MQVMITQNDFMDQEEEEQLPLQSIPFLFVVKHFVRNPIWMLVDDKA